MPFKKLRLLSQVSFCLLALLLTNVALGASSGSPCPHRICYDSDEEYDAVMKKIKVNELSHYQIIKKTFNSTGYIGKSMASSGEAGVPNIDRLKGIEIADCFITDSPNAPIKTEFNFANDGKSIQLRADGDLWGLNRSHAALLEYVGKRGTDKRLMRADLKVDGGPVVRASVRQAVPNIYYRTLYIHLELKKAGFNKHAYCVTGETDQ